MAHGGVRTFELSISPTDDAATARHADAFGLESGPEQLQPFFVDVRVERFDDALAVTDPEPVLAYIRSSERYRGEDLTDARRVVQKDIDRAGAFRIAKPLGMISCRTSRPADESP